MSNTDGTASHSSKTNFHVKDADALRARGFSIPLNNIVGGGTRRQATEQWLHGITQHGYRPNKLSVVHHDALAVDAEGKIVMRVRPEVSSGSVLAGIPSKKTIEVNTQLVAEDGQAILIAGLIKTSAGARRTGLPVLGDLPLVGGLFASDERTGSSTETIVLITPRIVPAGGGANDAEVAEVVERAEQELREKVQAPAALK